MGFNLSKIMTVLALVVLLGIIAGSAWGTAYAQEPDATPDAATVFIEAVSGGDVQSVTETADGGQVVVIEAPKDDAWTDTISVSVFGILIIAVAAAAYLLKKNNELSSLIRDTLPPEAWQSVFNAGKQTALDYAKETTITLDDDLVNALAKQVAALLKVKNE